MNNHRVNVYAEADGAFRRSLGRQGTYRAPSRASSAGPPR